jgi:uncharacterized BrkB/YihY/UPF0761 family membrane protein
VQRAHPTSGTPETWFDRVDGFQRRHRTVAFTFAVGKRYTEDRGAWLCSTISYYGFFSLLPALLAFVTIVYAVLGSRPTLLASVLSAVWATLPFAGEDTIRRIEPVQATGPVLVVSLLISLWGAVRVVRVLQDAFNIMWSIPMYERPRFLQKLTRGAAMLALIACAMFVSATLTTALLSERLPSGGAALSGAVNVAIDVLLVGALLRLLTARPLSVRDLWPGAIIAGTGIYLLTLLGGFYVDRVVVRASALYGSFAGITGLLACISLIVQVVVVANLVNVVRVDRLWPRSMTGRHLGGGDARAAQLSVRRAALLDTTGLDARSLS